MLSFFSTNLGKTPAFGITTSVVLCNTMFLQMNGFELAGRAMKVGHVTDRPDGQLGVGGQGGMSIY